MSTRKFHFKFLNLDGVVSFESEARTYGELKVEIRANTALFDKFGTKDFSDIHLIERETKTIYAVDDAILPATDAIMFVSITKSKGGGYTVPTCTEDLEDLKKMDYNNLRSLGSHLNKSEDAEIDLSGSKEDMLKHIYSYLEDMFEEDEEDTDPSINELLDTMDELTEELSDTIGELRATLSTSVYAVPGQEDPNVVVRVTTADLIKEGNTLYNNLRKGNLV